MSTLADKVQQCKTCCMPHPPKFQFHTHPLVCCQIFAEWEICQETLAAGKPKREEVLHTALRMIGQIKGTSNNLVCMYVFSLSKSVLQNCIENNPTGVITACWLSPKKVFCKKFQRKYAIQRALGKRYTKKRSAEHRFFSCPYRGSYVVDGTENRITNAIKIVTENEQGMLADCLM